MPEHVPIMVVKGLGTVHRQENGEFKFHSKYSDLQPGTCVCAPFECAARLRCL